MLKWKSLDICDVLEKVVNTTNVHERNDGTVSTKVKQFRCRYAKYFRNVNSFSRYQRFNSQQREL